MKARWEPTIQHRDVFEDLNSSPELESEYVRCEYQTVV